MTVPTHLANPSYSVVCVATEEPHRHILEVGTGDNPGKASKVWTVAEVRNALAEGVMFYTVSPSTGNVAMVGTDSCREPGCTVETIRSASDAVADNNLDNLRMCRCKAPGPSVGQSPAG